jgi:hypothetical protein
MGLREQVTASTLAPETVAAVALEMRMASFVAMD